MDKVFCKLFIVAFTLLILDLIWLGLLSKNLYLDNIGSLLRLDGDKIIPNWYAAAVVYFALITGIVFLVLPKAGDNHISALLWGAFFGFVTYSVYDFTNLAVLEHWSLKVSIIDTIWGMILCGFTSFIATVISK